MLFLFPPFLNTTATITPPPYCTTTSQAREREGKKSRSRGHLFCAPIRQLTQVSGVQTGWRGRKGCEPLIWVTAAPSQWPWGGRTTEPGWGQRGGDKRDAQRCVRLRTCRVFQKSQITVETIWFIHFLFFFYFSLWFLFFFYNDCVLLRHFSCWKKSVPPHPLFISNKRNQSRCQTICI